MVCAWVAYKLWDPEEENEKQKSKYSSGNKLCDPKVEQELPVQVLGGGQ